METSQKITRGRRVFFIGAAALSVLLVLEILIRVTGIGSPNVGMVYKGILVKGRPYARHVNLKENRNPVRFNNLGFHDVDRSPRLSGGKRAIFLGDSFTEAANVPVTHLFTTLLEKRFRAVGVPLEVMNAGISGAGTAKEYLLWKEFLRERVEAQSLVLVYYEGNDLADNHLELIRGLRHEVQNYSVTLDREGNVQVTRRPYSFLGRLARKICDYSALANLLAARLYLYRMQWIGSRAEQDKEMKKGPAQQGPDTVGEEETHLETFWQESVDGTLALLERWHEELKQEGVAFAVVVIREPGRALGPREVGGLHWKDEFLRRLGALSGERKFPLLDLDFSDYNPYGFYSFGGRVLGHFNFEGHRAAAERIYPWLSEATASYKGGLGEVAERTNAAVSKTVGAARPS